ncbi:MAG: outer membrane beta-barrel protein [Pseudomonadota bacterium]
MALAAGISLVSMGSVMAADEVVSEPSHIWSGFYAGIGFGGGAVVHDAGADLTPFAIIGFNGLGGEGVFGEVTAGYDFATAGGFVFGVGANARVSSIASTLEVGPILGPFDADITADYGFDVFARAGYLVTPQTMAYVLGGYSFQHFNIGISGNSSFFDWNSNGFVVGAGIETALTQRIHLKGEYRYSQFGSEDFDTGGILTVDPSFHTASLGLTYRFGTPAPTGSFAGATPVSFTGFYVGAAAAATGLTHNASLPPFPLALNGIGAEGIAGRLQAGYDYEFANGIVAGVQADIAYGNITTEGTLTSGGPNGSLNIDQEYSWSIVGRLGYKIGPRTMFYGLAGYTEEQYDINVSGGVGSIFDFRTKGFVAGGGIETAVTEQLFVGLEYRYAQTLEEFPLLGPIGIDLEPSSHTGMLTAKFKF